MCGNTSRKYNTSFIMRLNNELDFLIVVTILIFLINPRSGKHDEKTHLLAGKVLSFRTQLSGLSYHSTKATVEKKFLANAPFPAFLRHKKGLCLSLET